MRPLPDFPWDSLAPAKERASAFCDPSLAGAAGQGIVDLSVGTPVDPTPQVVRAALSGASDAHGYPQTWGTPDLREAVADGEVTRPVDDKKLMQARRAIEKAAGVLRQLGDT